MVLRSYVGGRWLAPASGAPVYDAVTGELVAEVSSDGVDFGAALSYGRSAGGPALRAMTFHERAELAKAAGQLLRDHRDELYQLSYRTGATLGDSKFDIDGGIGVLLSYASKAKRELPNERVLVEGAPEQLGKHGQFLGQHLLTPLLGVAVQINAFNFPVWGPLEKLAPGAHRRRADPGQAGLADRLPHRPGGGADRGVRAATRRRAAAGQRRRRGPARPSHRAGPAQLHRIGEHRPRGCGRTRTWSPGRCGSTPKRTR